MAGVRQVRRQLAVVGQEEQPFGLEIQTAHGIHVLAHAAQQIDDRRTPLRIRSRRQVTARLVQQEIAVMLDDLDPAAVHADVVVCRIRFRAELADSRAIHRDAAVEHQLLRRAARGDSGLRQDFLEALHAVQRTSRSGRV